MGARPCPYYAKIKRNGTIRDFWSWGNALVFCQLSEIQGDRKAASSPSNWTWRLLRPVAPAEFPPECDLAAIQPKGTNVKSGVAKPA